jgi:hypothetical protein
MYKVLTGTLIATVFSALIILSIEKQYSFYQISFGFLVYIIPVMFISSFKSRGLAFLITVISILFAYSSYRFQWHATWIGVLMSFSIGLPVYFFRVRKVKVQDGHNDSEAFPK